MGEFPVVEVCRVRFGSSLRLSLLLLFRFDSANKPLTPSLAAGLYDVRSNSACVGRQVRTIRLANTMYFSAVATAVADIDRSIASEFLSFKVRDQLFPFFRVAAGEDSALSATECKLDYYYKSICKN